jgi:hAT family C-terminal dimerisation region
LCTYYQQTDLATAYIVAVFRDPRRKLEFFQRHWTREWTKTAKDKLIAFYERYRDKSVDRVRSQMSQEHELTVANWPAGELTMVVRSKAHDIEELEDYLRCPNVSFKVDPWQYLRDNTHRWPTVTRMAFDVLGIPATSAEPERIFSRYIAQNNEQLTNFQRKGHCYGPAQWIEGGGNRVE